eukprot:jgi/Mesen1/8184/ME000044S07446
MWCYRVALRVGDELAYKVVQLTSSWTPEISSFRVGQVAAHDAATGRVVITSSAATVAALLAEERRKQKAAAEPAEEEDYSRQGDDGEWWREQKRRAKEAVGEGEGVEQEEGEEELAVELPHPYSADGTLEAELSSLMDVRVVKFAPGDRTPPPPLPPPARVPAAAATATGAAATTGVPPAASSLGAPEMADAPVANCTPLVTPPSLAPGAATAFGSGFGSEAAEELHQAATTGAVPAVAPQASAWGLQGWAAMAGELQRKKAEILRGGSRAPGGVVSTRHVAALPGEGLVTLPDACVGADVPGPSPAPAPAPAAVPSSSAPAKCDTGAHAHAGKEDGACQNTYLPDGAADAAADTSMLDAPGRSSLGTGGTPGTAGTPATLPGASPALAGRGGGRGSGARVSRMRTHRAGALGPLLARLRAEEGL